MIGTDGATGLAAACCCKPLSINETTEKDRYIKIAAFAMSFSKLGCPSKK